MIPRNKGRGGTPISRMIAMNRIGPGRPVFKDDFVGGASSGWTDSALGQNNSETPATSHNLSYVASPGRAGEYAMQIDISGDDWVSSADASANRERAELIRENTTEAVDGSEWWYAWSIYIPSTYDALATTSGKWEIIGQFHPVGIGGGPQPIIALRYECDDTPGPSTYDQMLIRAGCFEKHADITGEDASAGGETAQTTTFSITRDAWTDIKLHIKWAIGNGNGFIDTYVNGTLVPTDLGGTRMTVGTMYNSSPNDFRLGIYRGTALTTTNTLYIGRVRIARSNYALHLP